MPGNIKTYTFSGGELAPGLLARSDLEAYATGLAEALNWFVSSTGALVSRPGTKFIARLQRVGNRRPVRLYPFSFGTTIANTYIIIFGDHWIRFIQGGDMVLVDPPQRVAGFIRAEHTRITTNAQLVDDDLVYINGIPAIINLPLVVRKLSGQSYELHHQSGEPLNSLGIQRRRDSNRQLIPLTLSCIYTLRSPFKHEDLQLLQIKQTYDLVRITHPNFPIHNLIREGHTQWKIEQETIGHTGTFGDTLRIEVTSSEHQPTKDTLEPETKPPETAPKDNSPGDPHNTQGDAGEEEEAEIDDGLDVGPGGDEPADDFDDELDVGPDGDEPADSPDDGLDVGPTGDEPADDDGLDVGPDGDEPGDDGEAGEGEGGGEVGDGDDQGDE